jgi:replicative DNA helicase
MSIPTTPDMMLISKLVWSGNYADLLQVKEKGVIAERLLPDAQALFKFIEEYYGKYEKLPSVQTVLAETGQEIEQVDADLDYLADEVLNRNLFDAMLPELKDVAKMMELRKPVEAHEKIISLVSKIRHDNIVPSKISNLIDYGQSVLQAYQDAKDGKFGIMSPWEKLNRNLLGFQSEDLICVVARAGKGKSWMLLNLVEAARVAGAKPLIITTEMSELAMAKRYAALRHKIPYGYLRRGALTGFFEERLRDGILESQKNGDAIPIVGGEKRVTLDSIYANVDRCEPTIVFIDGLYLVQGEGANRQERVANVADEVKALCKRYKIPVVVTTQFNRTVDENATKAELGSLAMSDNIGWVSDIVMCLLQSKDMKRDKQMQLTILKSREGDVGDDILLNWDFEDMNFEQYDENVKEFDFR